MTIVLCICDSRARNDNGSLDTTGCMLNWAEGVDVVKFGSSSTVHVWGTVWCDMLR